MMVEIPKHIRETIFKLDHTHPEYRDAVLLLRDFLEKHNLSLRDVITFSDEAKEKLEADIKSAEDAIRVHAKDRKEKAERSLQERTKIMDVLEEELNDLGPQQANSQASAAEINQLQQKVDSLSLEHDALWKENVRLKKKEAANNEDDSIFSKKSAKKVLFALAATCLLGGFSTHMMPSCSSSDRTKRERMRMQTLYVAEVGTQIWTNPYNGKPQKALATLNVKDPVLVYFPRKNFQTEITSTWVEVESESGVSGFVLSENLSAGEGAKENQEHENAGHVKEQPVSTVPNVNIDKVEIDKEEKDEKDETRSIKEAAREATRQANLAVLKKQKTASASLENKDVNSDSENELFQMGAYACHDKVSVWRNLDDALDADNRIRYLQEGEFIMTWAYETEYSGRRMFTLASLSELKDYRQKSEGRNFYQSYKREDAQFAEIRFGAGEMGYVNIENISIATSGCTRSFVLKKSAPRQNVVK